MKKIKVVAAVIVKNNKVLIGKRAKFEKSPGLWEFPGGKIEINESKVQCIERELKEELDINAVIGDLITEYEYNYTHTLYSLSFYYVNSFTGEIALNAHEEIKWVDPKDFGDFDFLPGEKPVLESVKNHFKYGASSLF